MGARNSRISPGVVSSFGGEAVIGGAMKKQEKAKAIRLLVGAFGILSFRPAGFLPDHSHTPGNSFVNAKRSLLSNLTENLD
jgi:hypothetical protein